MSAHRLRLAFVTSVCVYFGLLLPPVAAIDRETVGRIKEATVFIRVEFGYPGLLRPISASGTGFVIAATKNGVYIVTNHHVLHPPEQIPGLSRVGEPIVVIGSGTSKEKSYKAEILGSDPSRDLAVLRIPRLERLPRPIDFRNRVDVFETMTVFIFGYPFGEALAVGKANPAPTIGKGSVSSIRKDEFGKVKYIQIDGDLNPGNSGGPVVDDKGRLIGVAVAKIRGTKIGLTIPADELRQLLLGRVGSIDVRQKKVGKGKIRVEFDARLIDPMGKLKEIAVRYVETRRLKRRIGPDKTGRFPPLPNGTDIELKIDNARAKAAIEITSPRLGKVSYTFQTAYLRADGKRLYTEPGRFVADFGTPPVAINPLPGKALPVTHPDSQVAGAMQQIQDLVLIETSLAPVKSSGRLCWSADGKHFFYLDADNVLHKVAWPSLTEVLRLAVGRKCSWLSVSKKGVLLTVAELQQVWLLAPEDFRLLWRIRAAGADRAVSVPALATAFVVDREGKSLTAYDLETRQAKRYVPPVPNRKLLGYKLPTLSPDGRNLFTCNFDRLHRFEVRGLDLVHKERTEMIGANPQGICVSPDGKYVCLPSGGGNLSSAYPSFSAGNYATLVFPASDLSRPEFVIRSGPYPRAVAFDPKGGRVLAHSIEASLIVFDTKGRKLKSYRFTRGRPEVYQILVDTDRQRAIVADKEGIFIAQLPKRTTGQVAKKNGQATPPKSQTPPKEASVFQMQAPRRIADLVVRSGTLPTRRANHLNTRMLWRDDAKGFYLLCDGMLYDVDYPKLSVRKRLKIPGATDLARCRDGLLVCIRSNGFGLIDPHKLELRRSWKEPRAWRIAAHPKCKYVYAVEPGGRSLHVVDLAAGKTVRRYGVGERLPGVRFGFNFGVAAIAPDGKRLFAAIGKDFHCLAIDGDALRSVDKAEGINRNGIRIAFSGDGRFVVLASGGGNVQGYRTNIYRTGDLSEPVVQLAQGPYPSCVVFDPRGDWIYTQNHTHQLLIFDRNGLKLAEHRLTRGTESVADILVHPEGRRLLIVAERSIHAVDLPDE